MKTSTPIKATSFLNLIVFGLLTTCTTSQLNAQVTTNSTPVYQSEYGYANAESDNDGYSTDNSIYTETDSNIESNEVTCLDDNNNEVVCQTEEYANDDYICVDELNNEVPCEGTTESYEESAEGSNEEYVCYDEFDNEVACDY